MSTAMVSSVRRRLACDRCHSFKLKCPRPAASSDGVCARCLKAGAACVYSPSMRGQVRAKASSGNNTMLRDPIEAGFDGSVSATVQDDLFNNTMTMDWSAYNATSLDEGLDWISQLPSQTEPLDTPTVTGETVPQLESNRPSTDQDQDGSNTHHSETASSHNQIDEQVHIVPNERTQRPKPSPQYLSYPMPESMQSPSLFLELINLSMHLENLSRELPPFSVHETADDDGLPAEETLPSSISASTPQTTSQPSPSHVPSNSSSKESSNSAGTSNIFAVMHKLVDLYQAVLKHLEQRQGIRNETADPEGKHISANDASLVYLLFSNHHRLVDIWHCVFTHSRTVLRTDRLPPGTGQQHKTHCGKMRLGSYVPSSSSRVVPMETIVVQELAVHLTGGLGDLMQAISTNSDVQSDSTEPTSSHDSAMISAAADLQQRMVGLQTAIRQLRGQLEEAIIKQAAITKQW